MIIAALTHLPRIHRRRRRSQREPAGRLAPSFLVLEERLVLAASVEIEQITFAIDGFSGLASISDNAEVVAFQSTADLVGLNPDRNNELFAYHVPTQNLLQLTVTDLIRDPILNIPRGIVSNTEPVVSGDGSTIAFVSNGNLANTAEQAFPPNPEVFVFRFSDDLASGTFFQVTSGFAVNAAPAINQDGSVVAFQASGDPTGATTLNLDNNFEIFRYDANTGVIAQITDTVADGGPPPGNLRPALSDSGAVVVFQSDADFGANPDRNSEIVLFDGVSFTQLTQTIGTGGAVAANGTASVSGDGATIAFAQSESDPANPGGVFPRVSVQRLGESAQVLSGFFINPQISRNGGFLSLSVLPTTVGGNIGITRYDVATGEFLPIADNGDASAVSRDGSVIVFQATDGDGANNVELFIARIVETPVQDPSPDPAPDPTPDPNPDPTPDPIPDPSPVPTPDPSPVPTPDPTPSPDPSPNPSPVPSPAPTPNPAPRSRPPAGGPTPIGDPGANPPSSSAPVPTPVPTILTETVQSLNQPVVPPSSRSDPSTDRTSVTLVFNSGDAPLPTRDPGDRDDKSSGILSRIDGRLTGEDGKGVGGREVYLDLNGDGVWQPGEPVAVTDRSGDYSLPVFTTGIVAVRLIASTTGVTVGIPDTRTLVDHVDMVMSDPIFWKPVAEPETTRAGVSMASFDLAQLQDQSDPEEVSRDTDPMFWKPLPASQPLGTSSEETPTFDLESLRNRESGDAGSNQDGSEVDGQAAAHRKATDRVLADQTDNSDSEGVWAAASATALLVPLIFTDVVTSVRRRNRLEWE